jgi:outer membrane receptor protein involved in Fe transport
MWRHEGHTTTLQGVWLDPYTVVDANVQREIVAGLRGFVSVENIANTQYQISLALPTSTTPRLEQRGLPRTVRVGVEAYRF